MTIVNSVVTDKGNKAIVSAFNGIAININKVKVGSQAGFQPLSNMINVVNQVYDTGFISLTSVGSPLTAVINTDGSMTYRFTMNTNIGDFTVGNIGLFLSNGDMYSLSVLSPGESKNKTIAPTIIGNLLTFDFDVRLSSNIVSLTVPQTAPANILTVPSELSLPPASSSAGQIYIVNSNGILYGLKTFAYSDGNTWIYSILGDTFFKLYKEQYITGNLPTIGINCNGGISVGLNAVLLDNSPNSVVFGNSIGQGSGCFIACTNGIASQGDYGVVIGNSNSITAPYATAIGGIGNNVSVSGGLAIGGLGNVVRARNAVAIGTAAVATHASSLVLGANTYGNPGSSQTEHVLLNGFTTSFTPLTLVLEDGSPLIIQLGRTWFFTGKIIGLSSTSMASWTVTGIIVNNSGGQTGTILITMFPPALGGFIQADVLPGIAANGWGLSVKAGSNSLQFIVTGDTNSVWWIADINISQIKIG